VVICDFTLHNDTRKLVAATYGRSMYSYDLNQDTLLTSAQPVISGIDFESVNVYPNPFKSAVNILFNSQIAVSGKVEVYDISGKRVASLYEGKLKSGLNEFRWRPVNTLGKVFLVKITAGGNSVTKKILYDK
jgi:hypothetical protein